MVYFFIYLILFNFTLCIIKFIRINVSVHGVALVVPFQVQWLVGLRPPALYLDLKCPNQSSPQTLGERSGYEITTRTQSVLVVIGY